MSSVFKSSDATAAAPTDHQYGNCTTTVQNHHQQHNYKNGDTVTGEAANGTTKAVPYATTGANGSIITMTLKNNHLIVETEERSVRENKIVYWQ